MSDRDDILWAAQRQARALQDVLADARLVWRDANARTAEQRFIQPRAAAEEEMLSSMGTQHQALNSADAEIQRTDGLHRVAAGESVQVGQGVRRAEQSARSACGEASGAVNQAQQAESLAASARGCVQQANAVGRG